VGGTPWWAGIDDVPSIGSTRSGRPAAIRATSTRSAATTGWVTARD